MSYHGEGSDDEMLYEYDDGVQPRKRQRLTHLSPGEKLQRRKLKNRVAAQAARDRRKAYMDELEEQVAELKAANKQLVEQNKQLRASQICPNCNSTMTSGVQSVNTASVKPESTSKSAVLSPQQKEQVQTLLALMTVLSSMVSPGRISQKSCSNCTQYSKTAMSTLQPLDLTSKSKMNPQSESIFQQWWGPQQSSWNPTETV